MPPIKQTELKDLYMQNLNVSQWKTILNQDEHAVILDVRRSQEFLSGHLPNAINMDIMDWHGFLEKLTVLDKHKSYFVYCRSGMRSAQAGMMMKQMGFNHIYNLADGLLTWDEPLIQEPVGQVI